jgi:hypothetical protein
MRFWHAVTLANNGRLDDALPIFRYVFAKDEDWRELALRLVPIGMLRLDEDSVERVKRL